MGLYKWKYFKGLMIWLEYLVAKMYISAILSGHNYLYEIYYVFKKKSKDFVNIKKEKTTKAVNIKYVCKIT